MSNFGMARDFLCQVHGMQLKNIGTVTSALASGKCGSFPAFDGCWWLTRDGTVLHLIPVGKLKLELATKRTGGLWPLTKKKEVASATHVENLTNFVQIENSLPRNVPVTTN